MNTHLNEGGPAFPFTLDNRGGEAGVTAFGDTLPADKILAYSGMSMRDYMAIHASDADVRTMLVELSGSPEMQGTTSYAQRSLMARYAVADAMLKVRAA